MEFEFDTAKSTANKAKHDIDFITAQLLWQDASRLEIAAYSLDEPRFQVLGLVGNRVWSAFVTNRNNKIRIISVRRARDNERKSYYDR
jgi:hypothetical protein